MELAESIRRLADFQDTLTDYVTDFTTNTIEKFYLVENELVDLNGIQAEMAETHDKNWPIFEEQLLAFCMNILSFLLFCFKCFCRCRLLIWSDF